MFRTSVVLQAYFKVHKRAFILMVFGFRSVPVNVDSQYPTREECPKRLWPALTSMISVVNDPVSGGLSCVIKTLTSVSFP
jgi:hypothetical protein